MIYVRNEVKSYDNRLDAEEELVLVESHWNDDNMVVLTVKGVAVTVLARDLEVAIKNATNTRRF